MALHRLHPNIHEDSRRLRHGDGADDVGTAGLVAIG